MPRGPFPACEEPIREEIAEAIAAALDRISAVGSWWSGAERVAIAREVRRMRSQRAQPPWLRDAPADDGSLPAAVLEVARRVSLDAHQLDRDWCRQRVEALGDAAYVEAVAVSVCVTAIDAFAEALGAEPAALPEPAPGEPDRVRPEGIDEVGAWVPMTSAWAGPNVGRALSLAPEDNQCFLGLVAAMYAVADFYRMVWDRPLSRPQVELVAARVSAVNECFY